MEKESLNNGKPVSKGRKGLHNFIFGRTLFIVILLALQIALVVSLVLWLNRLTSVVFWVLALIALVTVIIIFSSKSDPTIKLSWILLVGGLPLVGAIFYWFVQWNVGHRKLEKNVTASVAQGRLEQTPTYDVMDDIKINVKSLSNRSNYLINVGGFYPYNKCRTKYYPLGDDGFEPIKEALREAKEFIFLEYFIIRRGNLWDEILEILKEKVKEGVEVRVMYDGMNEFVILPHSYPKELESYGIKCKIFDPIRPFVSTEFNYRDHRKILVVDGEIAFTGGFNMADEYININSPYGHWKDNIISVEGPATSTFTRMFLEAWNIKEETIDFGDYIKRAEKAKKYDEEGYIIPFGENPLDDNKIAEQIYIEIINTAKHYVHVFTPYFVIDEVVSNALIYAAQRGIDVKIIIPGIPDKKNTFALTKSYRKRLVEEGVKFYEYPPGFVHSKAIISDDKKAVVGSINMDYRSFYHHFENGVYMYKSPTVKVVEEDFENTLSKCREDTLEVIKNEKPFTKFVGVILRLVAPML